jgi:hypothetical protein
MQYFQELCWRDDQMAETRRAFKVGFPWWGSGALNLFWLFVHYLCGKINSQPQLGMNSIHRKSRMVFFVFQASLVPMLIFLMLSLQSHFVSQANMGFWCCVCSSLWITLLCLTNCARANSLGEKWWQTFLEIKVSCSQWEGLTCIHERFNFLLLEGEERGHYYYFSPCSQCVPIMFPWGSQVIPQYFCNSISDLSHMVCPKFNSDVYKLKRWVTGEYICFCFVTGVQRGASIRELPQGS